MHVFEDEKLETLWDEIKFDIKDYVKKLNRITWKVQSEVLPAHGYLVITNPKTPDEPGVTYEYNMPSMKVPDWSPGLIFKPAQLVKTTKAVWDALPVHQEISWCTRGDQRLTLVCQRCPLDPKMCDLLGNMYVYQPFKLTLSALVPKTDETKAEEKTLPI